MSKEEILEAINNLNDDDDFISLMTDEEENEALRETYIEQGEKVGKQKIAKEMLIDNVPIDTIVKYTELTKEEINDL